MVRWGFMGSHVSQELIKAVKDDAVKRVAELFHYLVVHCEVKQYYYELKFVRSGSRLLELIGKALKDLGVIGRDEERRREIEELRLPSKEDESMVLEYYSSLGLDFIRALSGMVVASCRLCYKA
ncbi:MAG: hypothetical protein QXN15_11275 [Candidatus Jordarchaeales archaeon]